MNPEASSLPVLELLRKRCSVRRFSKSPVEQEKLEYILEAASVAPSAVNFQPWLFLVIRKEEQAEKLRRCYPREWFREAPVYIIACIDHDASWKRANDGKDHGDIDIAIATDHLCTAATDVGLGTCWVCNFDANLCRELFDMPENLEPAVIIPVGYPADADVFATTPKKRKAINEIIKWESL